MRVTGVRLAIVAAGLAAAMSACSSTSSGNGTAAGGGPSDGGAAGSTAAAPEKPTVVDDFERVCQDGLGFAGNRPYTKSKGTVHKLVLMRKSGASWVADSGLLDHYPSGWILYYPGEPSTAELVSCYERTKATPAGRTCPMEDNKTHEKFTVTMFNTQYRLRVLEAQTGKALYDKPGQAKSTDCPGFTTTLAGEDRTKYYTEASPEDYRGVLKQFITP